MASHSAANAALYASAESTEAGVALWRFGGQVDEEEWASVERCENTRGREDGATMNAGTWIYKSWKAK